MRVNLVENEAPHANSAYDPYYCFYYDAKVADTGVAAIPWLHLREDSRIYLNDRAGITFDLICNKAGMISSIAFRREIIPGQWCPEFDHLLPVPETALLAVVANPDIEAYAIESIRPMLLQSPKYGNVILVSLDALSPTRWHPISRSAFIGVDDAGNATAFLFFDVQFSSAE